MKFDIVTIFPDIFGSYFNESILKRAQKEKLIEIKIHNLRDFTKNIRKTVDDTPYGGGAGMVLKVEPIFDCLKSIKKSEKTRTILFSAKGKRLTQMDVQRLSQYENLIMICGRYEGVDERVAQNLVDEEISIGDYVLTGGELPAMIMIDTITRRIPGVLGDHASVEENRISSPDVYTRPEVIEYKGKRYRVPKVLLSGNHAKMDEWRETVRTIVDQKEKKIKK